MEARTLSNTKCAVYNREYRAKNKEATDDYMKNYMRVYILDPEAREKHKACDRARYYKKRAIRLAEAEAKAEAEDEKTLLAEISAWLIAETQASPVAI
jgi:hypothetical protein